MANSPLTPLGYAVASVSTPDADKGKALVTGGAGFIGSHLCELLLADGWEEAASQLPPILSVESGSWS